MREIKDVTITYDQNTVHNSIEIRSNSKSLFRRADPSINAGTERIVVYLGITRASPRVLRFLIEDLRGEEGAFTIWGRSVSARNEPPYTKNVDVVLESFTPASSVARNMLSYGSLIWNTIDWNLPDGFEFEGSPIAGIQLIAQSVGAIVRSDDSGNIIVRNKYTVDPSNLQKVGGDVGYDRYDDIYSLSFNIEKGTGENRIEVDGYGPSIETPIIEVEDRTEEGTNIGADVYIRIYWTGQQKRKIIDKLVTDGVLKDLGENTSRIEDNIIAFENGIGTAQYPVHSGFSGKWLGINAGIISYSMYSTELKCPAYNFGVYQATYTTLYHRYLARSHNVVAILAVLELDEGAGINVIITRGPGDLPAKGITDGNLTTIASAKQKGLAYLNDKGYDKKVVEIQVPYEEKATDGNIAYVNNAEIDCTGNFYISSVIIEINGPKLANRITILQCLV